MGSWSPGAGRCATVGAHNLCKQAVRYPLWVGVPKYGVFRGFDAMGYYRFLWF